jgi:DNA repair protein SbcC/Rad50
LGALHERITCGERAASLDSQLAGLPAAEQVVEEALNQWHACQARRTQLEEAIRHDTEHRQAVLSGETQAACPTCKRELEDIVAAYERDLQAQRQQVADIDAELVKLKAASTKARAEADALRGLAADRRTIIDAPNSDALPGLRDEVSKLDDELARLADQETRAEAQLAARAEQLPRLRSRAREAEVAQQRFADIDVQRAQAENEARLYAEQLSSVGANGYDANAHMRLRTELVEAQEASQRCAALRAKAGGLELLCRRLAEQEAKVTAADTEQAKLAEAVAEVAVEPSALQATEEAYATCDKELEAAHAARLEAHRQASSDSEAVAAAHARLQDARERTAQLREQRGELRVRSEVADALSAYREDASRRARPMLEHETGLLLGQTTRQRYSAVQLTDGYQLEIVDGRQLHPLQRFSGGEQDLAGLCLRLALSRTLARQRGAETDFVLLDEVFGSQDPDRRLALLDQLHAIAEGEFRQVFVVSHTEDVIEHCDLTIDVARDDEGVSSAIGPHT